MKILYIHTCNKHSIKYLSSAAVDITVKSGKKCFAPTWKMVMDFKSGLLPRDEYERQYRSKMLKSMVNHKNEWEALFDLLEQKESLWFTCYCVSPDWCHRRLFAHILADAYNNSDRGDICKAVVRSVL